MDLSLALHWGWVGVWMRVLVVESHNLDRPDPVGSHQYVRLFREAGHDCLWLGPAVSPMHVFKLDELNRYRFRVWRGGVRSVDGVGWLVPFTLLFYYNLPLLRSLFAGRNQFRFCVPPLNKQLKKAGFAPVDLLWCAGPVAYSLLDIVPHQISCYRLADRLNQFSGIPANVEELQKELIRRVDFVLATSRSLFDWALSVGGKKVYYLPNGVSDQFFQKAGPAPADFPAGGKPVAVYAGTIDTRFDLDTLTFAVKNLPGVHFLLIGAVTSEPLLPGLQSLVEHDNFTMLGPKAYQELPAYLQRCAVGLIPFHLNELTEAVNPIKYYEYLASGLPVVAPMMREMVEMKGPRSLYRNKDEFCSAIAGLLGQSAEQRDRLKETAAQHTWRARYLEVEEIIAGINS
jgi:glycosyltransferase involved in cell wall biosynthesis